MDNWSHVGLIIVVIISVFYATAYFSLRNFSRLKLEEILTKRNKLSRLSYLQEREVSLLLTCVIVRIALAIAFVMLVIKIITHGDLSQANLIKSFIVSMVSLAIFAIALPHAWANYAANGFLASTLPILKLSEKILLPILALMHGTDVIIRRLSGASNDSEDDEHVQQEILEAVQEGQDEGVVGLQERKMIESVIELRTIDVGQIMTPRTEIVAIETRSSLDEIKRTILEHGHSRIPVYDDSLDNIIGMLYVKDLLPLLGEDISDFDLRNLMRQCYFVPETKNLRDIFSEFRIKKIHVAVVLDEYGGTLGMVTFEDVIEQIVGQVADEYEPIEKPLVRQIDAKTLELDGRTRIDELNDDYPVELPESDDYETVSGFLFSSLGRIPDAGETFQYLNLLFTVLDATERKINRVRLEILPNSTTVSNENSNGKKSRNGS